jgi:hypothetical protein
MLDEQILKDLMLDSTPRIERLVPVPQMSPAGFTVFSEINAAKYPSRALHDAFMAGMIPIGDLPEIIANIWTRDDSPTSSAGEADWLEVFRRVGFFSWPPLVVRQADCNPVKADHGRLKAQLRPMRD